MSKVLDLTKDVIIICHVLVYLGIRDNFCCKSDTMNSVCSETFDMMLLKDVGEKVLCVLSEYTYCTLHTIKASIVNSESSLSLSV